MFELTRYRTFGARFWAALVDGIVFVPLGFVDELLLAPGRPSWVIATWAAVSYSSYWLYSVLLHARFGQTVGKKLLRVKVLDVGEAAVPSLRQAFLRDIGLVVLNTTTVTYVIYLIFTVGYTSDGAVAGLPGELIMWAGMGWLALELLTMLTNGKRRALHDYIAGTVVVRDA